MISVTVQPKRVELTNSILEYIRSAKPGFSNPGRVTVISNRRKIRYTSGRYLIDSLRNNPVLKHQLRKITDIIDDDLTPHISQGTNTCCKIRLTPERGVESEVDTRGNVIY